MKYRTFGARVLLAAVLVALGIRTVPSLSATRAWDCPMQQDWCGGADGVWWAQLGPAAKLAAVQGMIAAYELAYNEGQFTTVSYWVTAYENDNDQSAASKLHALIVKDRGASFSKSPSAYVAGIDLFYKRYPAKRLLKVVGVLRCLRDHPEATCDEVGKSPLLPWPTGV